MQGGGGGGGLDREKEAGPSATDDAQHLPGEAGKSVVITVRKALTLMRASMSPLHTVLADVLHVAVLHA